MKGKQRKIMLKVIIVLLAIIILDSIAPFITSNANVFAAAAEWVGEEIFEAIAHFLASIADTVIETLQEIFINPYEIKVYDNGEYKYLIRYSPGIIFSGTVPGLDINFIHPMEPLKVSEISFTADDYIEHKELAREDENIKIGTWNGQDVYICLSNEIDNGNPSYFYLCTFDENGYAKEYTNGVRNIYSLMESEEITTFTKAILSKQDQTAYSMYDTYVYNDFVGVNDGETGSYAHRIISNGSKKETLLKKDCYINGKKYELYVRPAKLKSTDSVKDDDDYNIEYYSVYNGKETSIVRFRHGSGIRLDNGKIISKTDLRNLIQEDITSKSATNISGDSVDKTKGEIVSAIQNAYKDFLNAENKTYESSAKKLQKTIATWYNVMKDIALVGLLSVLVYVSIRMIISSSTEDKAKYKKMIADWVAAICIIYLLHYFMSLVLTVTQALSDVFNASIIGETGEDILMSSIRTNIEAGQNFVGEFANIIIYLVLVILTVMFTYQYLKRFIYVAFLTMVAPLIALTYPLDKIRDGKAQAFTTWLREYLFTVLIQVIHLIIYYVLLGATNDLLDGSNPQVYNPIFAIVAISFILPAEKFIRNMFGFNKAEATNSIGSALGGAALMKAINKLGKKATKGPKQKDGETKESNSNIRTANQLGNSGISPDGLGNEQGSNWDGAKNVAKKYVFNKENGKKLVRGAGKVAGAGVLGTAGLAAGIATGEMENAIAGATGGMAAGSRVGGNLVDGGANLISSASSGIQGIKDTYGAGKYGEEAYAKMQQNEAFRNSADYSKLTSRYPGQEGDIEAFLNAGVTDAGKMNTAMQSIKDGKYNAQDAITYMKMAEQCPAEILYDKENFKTFVTTLGYSEGVVEKIRKGISDFK